MLQCGTGSAILAAVRESLRAVVFVSVLWSASERAARQIFHSSVKKLEESHSDLGIACFQLDVDQDELSAQWLSSLGYPQFAQVGAGSLLWLQYGNVRKSEITANSLGLPGIIECTRSLWP